jgi:hypothetical protein
MGVLVFFVKKKVGSLHLVQDYRKLNEITVKNSYPLPLISDILACLRNAKYFSVLDQCWGFNNVRIKDHDEWKAAFVTNRGLFKSMVMFFGLCNSPETFQTMMNDILRDFINWEVVICYMDDILIFTTTLEEHRRVVWGVLEMLWRRKLFLKPEKCKFKWMHTSASSSSREALQAGAETNTEDGGTLLLTPQKIREEKRG